MQQEKLWLPQERPGAFSRTGTFCADVAMGITTSLLEHQSVRFKLKLLGLCRNCTSWWWPNFYILIKSRTGCQHTEISCPCQLPTSAQELLPLHGWLPDVCQALRSWCSPDPSGIVLKVLPWCQSGTAEVSLSTLYSTNLVQIASTEIFPSTMGLSCQLCCPWPLLSRDPVPPLQGPAWGSGVIYPQELPSMGRDLFGSSLLQVAVIHQNHLTNQSGCSGGNSWFIVKGKES